ncbi:MAG TPA: glycosyltransferase 87 family protein [Thermoanaerobaculia bacterium]|nr:glycosyltransferase 87 family protein [Thermoanaerobaculia bacterium]
MHLSARARFVVLIVTGVAIRVLLIATSIGTNDVLNWMTFGRLVDNAGIGPSYGRIAEVNHPPLSLLIVLGLEKIRLATSIEVGDLLRLLQVLFDLAAVAALLDIGRSIAHEMPQRLALFYFLSPVSIFITGFHGNTDPAMVALLLISVALLIRTPSRPFFAGVVFALAVGIKIVPLLLLPLFLLLRKDRRFVAGAAAGGAAIFLPFLPTGGMTMLRQIFGYNTQGGNSGLAYFLATIGDALPAAQPFLLRMAIGWIAIAKYVIVAAVIVYALALARRHERSHAALLAGTGTTLLIILALGPGGGVQYLLWPVAFLPFALGRVERLILVASYSAAQFTVYTIWSDGFPWWYADSTIRRPWIDVSLLGDAVFLLTFAAAARGVWRSLRPATSSPSSARSA